MMKTYVPIALDVAALLPELQARAMEIFHKILTQALESDGTPMRPVDPMLLDMLENGINAGVSAMGEWITDNDLTICREL